MTGMEARSLKGFVHPIGQGACFLIPFFEYDERLWTQEINHKGVITGFTACYLPASAYIIYKSNSLNRRVGDLALFAFYFGDGSIIADTKIVLRQVLESRIVEFNELPFLKLDVLKFIGKKDLFLEAVNAASDRLRSLNPQIADNWRERTEHHLYTVEPLYAVKTSIVLLLPGKQVELDEDGYLTNLDDWSEDVAKALADEDKLELTDAHWEVIHFLRDYYQQYQIAPMIKILVNEIKKKMGADTEESKYLYQLFPHGPAKQAFRYAGLPNPPKADTIF